MPVEFNGLSASHNANPSRNRYTQLVKKTEILPADKYKETEQPLAEAIRLYRNYSLTGVRELTSEEKEEIKNHIENYLEENKFLEKYSTNEATQKDYAALNVFIKELYERYGKKGDFYEFTTELVGGILKKAADPKNPPRPPFKVEIPPEYAQTSAPKKPMLMPFQSPLAFQLPKADESSGEE